MFAENHKGVLAGLGHKNQDFYILSPLITGYKCPIRDVKGEVISDFNLHNTTWKTKVAENLFRKLHEAFLVNLDV